MSRNTSGLKPPWKPGQSGNPKGYSNKGRIQSMFQKYFQKHPNDEMEVLEALFAAAKGIIIIDPQTGKERNSTNVKAAQLIFEYRFGKVPNNVNIHGMDNPGREGQRFNEILAVEPDDSDNT